MNSTTLTPMKAAKIHNHSSQENGLRKVKADGSVLSGFFIMRVMPRLINGFEKSTTRWRVDVMVRGAMARSAS